MKMNSILLKIEDLKFQNCKCCAVKYCNVVIMICDVPGMEGVMEGMKMLTDDTERPCPDCQKKLEKQIFKSSEN